jgi:hypothetical protein
VIDWLSTPVTPGRLLLTGVILAGLYWTWAGGRALVVWVRGRARVAEIKAEGEADVARIRETGKVLRSLAKLEPDQVERLHGRLDRV